MKQSPVKNIFKAGAILKIRVSIKNTDGFSVANGLKVQHVYDDHKFSLVMCCFNSTGQKRQIQKSGDI